MSLWERSHLPGTFLVVIPTTVCVVAEIVIHVPPHAGAGRHWGEWMILREPPVETVVLDLKELRFADPLFLARMRGFIDWHCSLGREVRITCPRLTSVQTYLERMHLASDLPASCICDLGTIGTDERSDVLIPIRRLYSPSDVDGLDQELEDLYLAHFEGPLGKLAEAFTATVGEISDNATTHGRSEVGVSYITAQRYKRNKCVLAIGDLGIGIPEHLRGVFPNPRDDGDAIREATKEGVTGTGKSDRGFGYQHVINASKETKVPRGELRIWSGHGRFRVETRGGIQARRRAWTIERASATRLQEVRDAVPLGRLRPRFLDPRSRV